MNHVLGSIAEVVGGNNRQTGIGQDLLAEIDIGAFEADDERHMQADCARRADDALRNHVAAHDTTENIDQHTVHVWVREDDLKGLGHALAGGTAADIEKIGRLAAVQLDEIHRRHGEAGAIDHAADIAVELYVVEIIAGRRQFARILLALVAQVRDIRLAIERVVIEVHFSVER